MRSRAVASIIVVAFLFLPALCVYAQSQTHELVIYPKAGSGLTSQKLTGARVTLAAGDKKLTGTVSGEGIFVSSTGSTIDVRPGKYEMSVELEGYQPYTMEITVLEQDNIEDWMPDIPTEVEVSLVPEPVVPPVDDGGGPVTDNFWGYVTLFLIIVIVILMVAILVAFKRRRPVYSGGAAAVKEPHRPLPVKPAAEEIADRSPAGRFTGKHFGRYLVTKTIARGGMAYIVQAEFKKGNNVNRAALKIPYENYQEDKEFVNRFNQEAELGDILFHENIIEIYEYGVAKNGTRFIAMEFVDGADLRNILESDGKVEPTRAARIVMDIAKALDYAHGQNPPVYHRDIKPENIMFRDRAGKGIAVLTDFGIATQGGTMGTGKALIGTALYSCPDSARRVAVSPGYDIYSLGVVFYEMLTGAVPFTGDDYYSIMRRHEEEAPRPPGELNKKIPPELEAVVLKMMEKDPKRRFGSTKELLIVLRDYLT